MKKLPFYEVKAIRRAENDENMVIVQIDGGLMLFEFVSRGAFQEIRRIGGYTVVGYLTRGGDAERVYTMVEMFCEPGLHITPGFYPPRDDN